MPFGEPFGVVVGGLRDVVFKDRLNPTAKGPQNHKFHVVWCSEFCRKVMADIVDERLESVLRDATTERALQKRNSPSLAPST